MGNNIILDNDAMRNKQMINSTHNDIQCLSLDNVVRPCDRLKSNQCEYNVSETVENVVREKFVPDPHRHQDHKKAHSYLI